jgi:hypothetical protein
LHPDEETALVILAAGPFVHVRIDLLPPAEIEVTDAEIRAFGNDKGLLQSGEQLCLDVIENAGHGRSSGIERCADVAYARAQLHQKSSSELPPYLSYPFWQARAHEWTNRKHKFEIRNQKSAYEEPM